MIETRSRLPGVLNNVQFGKDTYPALTGVRAAGATAVFFDHFPLWPDAHITLNVMAFFFVLSGFLIFRLYYEQAQFERGWLRKYFTNRLARIYPTYFLLLSLLVVCLHAPVHAGLLIKNYTLTHALFHGTPLLIEPSWTLTVEECFYALGPLFMILTRRSGLLRSFGVACLLSAAALLISTLGIAFLGTPQFVLSATFFGHFAEFFAGAGLALAVINTERQGSWRLSGSQFTLSGAAGVFLLVTAMVIVYRHTPLHHSAILLINNFLIPLPVVVLYWGLMREDTSLSRLLANPVAALLGRSSYSFYLAHSPIINYLGIPLLLPWAGSRPLAILLTFAITWWVSILLFAWYEEPMNLLIRRKLSSKGALSAKDALDSKAALSLKGARTTPESLLPCTPHPRRPRAAEPAAPDPDGGLPP